MGIVRRGPGLHQRQHQKGDEGRTRADLRGVCRIHNRGGGRAQSENQQSLETHLLQLCPLH